MAELSDGLLFATVIVYALAMLGSTRIATEVATMTLVGGTHSISASRTGYAPKTMPFTVVPGAPVQKIILALDRVSSNLALLTSPANIEVIIDGVSRGVTELDPEATRRKMEKLVGKIEALLPPDSKEPVANLSPAEMLARQWREALAANTMGAAAARQAEDARHRAVEQEVRSAQSAWQRLGPLDSVSRFELGDRHAERHGDDVRCFQNNPHFMARPLPAFAGPVQMP